MAGTAPGVRVQVHALGVEAGNGVWVLVPPVCTLVSDFVHHIRQRHRHLRHGTLKRGLHLQLHGCALPGPSPIGLIRDGDVLIAKPVRASAVLALTSSPAHRQPAKKRRREQLGPPHSPAAPPAEAGTAASPDARKRKRPRIIEPAPTALPVPREQPAPKQPPPRNSSDSDDDSSDSSDDSSDGSSDGSDSSDSSSSSSDDSSDSDSSDDSADDASNKKSEDVGSNDKTEEESNNHNSSSNNSSNKEVDDTAVADVMVVEHSAETSATQLRIARPGQFWLDAAAERQRRRRRRRGRQRRKALAPSSTPTPTSTPYRHSAAQRAALGAPPPADADGKEDEDAEPTFGRTPSSRKYVVVASVKTQGKDRAADDGVHAVPLVGEPVPGDVLKCQTVQLSTTTWQPELSPPRICFVHTNESGTLTVSDAVLSCGTWVAAPAQEREQLTLADLQVAVVAGPSFAKASQGQKTPKPAVEAAAAPVAETRTSSASTPGESKTSTATPVPVPQIEAKQPSAIPGSITTLLALVRQRRQQLAASTTPPNGTTATS